MIAKQTNSGVNAPDHYLKEGFNTMKNKQQAANLQELKKEFKRLEQLEAELLATGNKTGAYHYMQRKWKVNSQILNKTFERGH